MQVQPHNTFDYCYYSFCVGGAPGGYHQQHGPPSGYGTPGEQYASDSLYGEGKGTYQGGRGVRGRDQGLRKYEDYKEATPGISTLLKHCL